jgi:hypothetical protein
MRCCGIANKSSVVRRAECADVADATSHDAANYVRRRHAAAGVACGV